MHNAAPTAPTSAVGFRDLPVAAAAIRVFAVECTTCYSLALRGSADDHAAWHVTEALRASGILADPPPVIATEDPASG